MRLDATIAAIHRIRIGLLCVATIAITPSMAANLDVNPRLPIGFTIVPMPRSHHNTRSERAAMIDPWNTNASPVVLQIDDPLFWPNQGTDFWKWLKGGTHALIVRVSFPDGVCLKDGFGDATCPTNEYRAHNMIVDTCMIDTRTHKVVVCPTMIFGKDHGRPSLSLVGDYSYNEVPFPRYTAAGKLSGFGFATHPKPPITPGVPEGVEWWISDVSGHGGKKLVDSSTHGCDPSPDFTLMVCESAKIIGGSVKPMVLVRISDATPIGSILEDDETMEGLRMEWSPNSEFLVFTTNKKNVGGAIVKQSVKGASNCKAGGEADCLKLLMTNANHKILAKDIVPAYFCAPANCDKLGVGDASTGMDPLGSDYFAFSPIQPGERGPKWLALTIVRSASTGNCQSPGVKCKRVIYIAALDGKDQSKTIDLKYDAGYPAFSPDSKKLAFLSIPATSALGNRATQLFVADLEATPLTSTQLTHIPDKQVANPHWGSP